MSVFWLQRMHNIGQKLLLFINTMLKISFTQTHLITLDMFPRKTPIFHSVWNNYVKSMNNKALLLAPKVTKHLYASFVHSYAKQFSIFHSSFLLAARKCYSGNLTQVSLLAGIICDHNTFTHTHPSFPEQVYEFKNKELFNTKCTEYLNYIHMRKVLFSFSLHERLMLNLSLLVVNIELTFKCRTEYVGFGKTRAEAMETRVCGKMPVSSHFLESESFVIIQVGQDTKPFRIELQFQVTDPKHINFVACPRKLGFRYYCTGSLSQQIPETHQGARPSVYFSDLYLNSIYKQSAQIIHAQGKRNLLVGAKIKMPLVYIGYDGPYIDETLLLKNKSIINSHFHLVVGSTFQMTLRVAHNLQPEKALFHGKNSSIYFFAKQPPTCKFKVLSKPKTIKLNQSHFVSDSCTVCGGYKHSHLYCVLDLETDDRSQVNMSMNYLKYGGPNVDSCRQVVTHCQLFEFHISF